MRRIKARFGAGPPQLPSRNVAAFGRRTSSRQTVDCVGLAANSARKAAEIDGGPPLPN
jgi:hypothetical protein